MSASSNSIITQCPGCNASFRVSPGQLKVAAGQVRCGACLQVFTALEHQPKPPQTATRARRSERKMTDTPRPVADSLQPHYSELSRRQSQHQAQPLSQKPPKQEPRLPRTEPELPQTKAVKPPIDTQGLTTPLKAETAVVESPQPEESDAPTHNDKPIPTLNISAEPVVIQSHIISHVSYSPGWLIASILGIAILLFQFVWFQRDTLAHQPEYRPLYTQLCAVIECAIPPRSELKAVNHTLVGIRPHNDYKEAIVAEVLLTNRASFEQPYPALQLAFSDLKGRTVVRRTFQPLDYLDPTLAKHNRMPSDQAVQVSIPLLRPGKRAVSYELKLLAPAL